MTVSNSYEGIGNLEAMLEARRYNAFLTKLVDGCAPGRGRVLDFGAGMGTYTRFLANGEREFVCIEPDTKLRAELEQEGFEVHPSPDALAENSFDFIYSLNVLEHIEDDEEAVKKLFRILKPGGRLLVYVPAFEVLYSAMDAKVGHFRRYNRWTLKEILERTGFSIVRNQYADSLGFFAALVYKTIGNKDGSLNRGPLIVYDRIFFPLSRCLDMAFSPFFGKNLSILAQKP